VCCLDTSLPEDPKNGGRTVQGKTDKAEPVRFGGNKVLQEFYIPSSEPWSQYCVCKSCDPEFHHIPIPDGAGKSAGALYVILSSGWLLHICLVISLCSDFHSAYK